MASLRLEGAIDGLNDVQIQFVRDVLEKQGFKDNKVLIEPVGKSGDNYVANVMRISTIVEGGDDFRMVGKFAPQNEALRKMMNTDSLFNNEIVMYEEVLPKFTSLQLEANVPEKDILRYAKSYGCLAEPPHEVILLEDLKESNFDMLDRFSFLSNDAVRLILRNFAIIHSLSYILKEKETETYDRFRTKLFDIWNSHSNNEEFTLYLKKLEEDVMTIIDEEKYKEVLRGIIPQATVCCNNLRKVDKYSKHLVILQGDSWTNNIMFKLKGGIPLQCIMIDYQLSREDSPVSDILYMIFNCTDHITRTEYYNDWIDYYHDQLDKSLSDYGLKVNLVYPRDQLDADLKKYSKMYFGLTVMLYSVLCRNPEEAAAVKDSALEENKELAQSMMALENLGSDTVKLYKSRVQDLVDSYQMLGYL